MPRRRAAGVEMLLPLSVHRMWAPGGRTAHVSATELPARTTLDRGSTVNRGTSVDDVITPTINNVIIIIIIIIIKR